MKTVLCALALAFLVSGCLSPAWQYRGFLSGVEVEHTEEGTTRVNVSGNAKVEVDENGNVTIESQSENKEVLDFIMGR